MRLLDALVRNLTFSSIGQTWEQPPFWTVGGMLGGPLLGDKERIPNSFDGYVQAFKSAGPVFTCIVIRQHILSEGRFLFQTLEGGRPGELHDGSGDLRRIGPTPLALLETPWPNGTTGELLSRMEQDASLAGNFFATTVGEGSDRGLRRLRPDWVTIVTGAPDRDDGSPGSPYDLEAKVVGYLYHPKNTGLTDERSVLLTPEQVVHWSPLPDPDAQWRGMSWVTAVSSEVDADKSATDHKRKFFDNGATSNIIVSYDPTVPKETVKGFTEQFAEKYEGTRNAYKTIHLGGGADAKMIGADLKQLDFKATQGAGESRIAAASLVGAVVAQLSEGMQGSSLNAGNFQAARRRFADIWARPTWRSVSAALSKVVDVPTASRLWIDTRDVSFLQEDEKDAAEIFQLESASARQLIDGGWTPDSVAAAVKARDIALLRHTGAFSVQLQPPGSTDANARIRVPANAVPDLLASGWTVASETPALVSPNGHVTGE